jgi:hypothetical protein
MFDRNKFLALLPTGDHNLDEAVSSCVSLIEDAQRNQAPSNLVMKLSFQANVIQSKLSLVESAKQHTLEQLLGVIQGVKQQHERRPFITGRGISPVEDGDLFD